MTASGRNTRPYHRAGKRELGREIFESPAVIIVLHSFLMKVVSPGH